MNNIVLNKLTIMEILFNELPDSYELCFDLQNKKFVNCKDVNDDPELLADIIGYNFCFEKDGHYETLLLSVRLSNDDVIDLVDFIEDDDIFYIEVFENSDVVELRNLTNLFIEAFKKQII